MNANIMKMQIFHKIKYDLRGHSWSQIMTFMIKNSPFLLFMLLIDWRNKCRWRLWKNKVWLIQRQHMLYFDLNLRSYGQLFVLVFYKNECGQNWKYHSFVATRLRLLPWLVLPQLWWWLEYSRNTWTAIAILDFSLLLPL